LKAMILIHLLIMHLGTGAQRTLTHNHYPHTHNRLLTNNMPLLQKNLMGLNRNVNFFLLGKKDINFKHPLIITH